jgi:cytochrome oxidase Cu insertion factor (SCO1/SenC/PrrC family)/thiol-disulfide isomerase/thioredoxin
VSVAPQAVPGRGRRALVRLLWIVPAVVLAVVAVAHLLTTRSGSPSAILAAARAAGVDAGTPLNGQPAPDFRLTDQFGRTESLASFRGRVVILSFASANGTGMSPITAQVQRDAQTALGAAARYVQLLAVNTDAAAPAAANVLAWSQAHGMSSHWLFLTGTPEALASVWHAYHVSVLPVTALGPTHTAAIFIIGPRGRERYVFTTTADYAQGAVQGEAVAARVTGLLPRGVAPAVLRPAASAAPSPPVGGAFSLPALTPSGAATRVTVAEGPGAQGTRLVAFFATWCPSCREDLKTLDSYAARARASSTVPPVVGVDLRVAEPSTATVRSFVEAQGVSFPVALDRTGSVADAYGVTALPYLALVSGTGHILWRHVGVLDLHDLLSQIATAAKAGAVAAAR